MLALAGLVGSCDAEPAVEVGPEDRARGALVTALLTDVVVPTHQRFAIAAAALSDASAAYAVERTEARIEVAREAWRVAMATWQEAELMQLGPAASGDAPGARALRDEIYSWPTTNPCRVDQEVVSEGYASDDFFDRSVPNVYGLDTLEYLLFSADATNACEGRVRINSEGSWDALGEEEVAERRARYAAVVAARLVVDAQRLLDAWPSSPDYESGQAGLNDVFRALFYVELLTKDVKLGIPAGIASDCSADVCVDALESRYAHHSKENVLGNLRGVRALLLGEVRGFDDLLREEGAGELADRLQVAVDGAATALTSVEGTLQEALVSEPASVRDGHAAVKVLTDLLKTEVVTVLSLSVPQEGAGDND